MRPATMPAAMRRLVTDTDTSTDVKDLWTLAMVP
jgi:hypothetical protein